jgi:HEXXH motif-containing protein
MHANPTVGEECATATAWGGWFWRPDSQRWFERLATLSGEWSPEALALSDASWVRDALVAAATAQSAWLVHPCVAALLAGSPQNSGAQARLALWTAVNLGCDTAALGTIDLAEDTIMFGPGGAFVAHEGLHDLAALAREAPASPYQPVPDPWGHSLPEREVVGELGDCAWWSAPPDDEAAHTAFQASLAGLVFAQERLRETLPDTARWLTNMAKVTVPLRKGDGDQFRSGSISGVPGLVMVEVTDRPLLTMEALVHETAHLYFHFAEMTDPFVRAGHGSLYASPLRRDPRPLRGIFLAYHALLYMCALYQDLLRATGDRRCREAFLQLSPLREDARRTLADGRAELTAAGADFLVACEALEAELATSAGRPADA